MADEQQPTQHQFEVHPLANIFPMLGELELAALAKDIKQNGQHYPILLGPDGCLLDGRNRLQACRLAGVEPRVVVTHDDPVAVVVGGNLKQRHLTASQKAIAAAEMWDSVPEAARELFPNKDWRRDWLTNEFGVNEKYVQMAHGLVQHAPHLAAAVKDEGLAITEAHDKRKAHEEQRRKEARGLDYLRTQHPDLADAVQAGGRALDKALDEAYDRARKERSAQERAADLVRRAAEVPADEPAELARLYQRRRPHLQPRERTSAAQLHQAASYWSSVATELAVLEEAAAAAEAEVAKPPDYRPQIGPAHRS